MLDSGWVLTFGQIVPDYELLRRIGGGAYGEVWLARNKATGVLRAAKIVWRHTFDEVRPFEREFEGIQRFERISREHPSQLAIFHVGRNDLKECFYYVMELADNLGTASDYTPRTLRADLQHERLPAARVLEIGLALAEALGHLHHHGLVHRDVKPSNVIFVKGRPKLADIGLVTDASDTRSIVGTEGYLPPEGPGTPQADIFALGKVLYQALTGFDRREFPRLPDDLRAWSDRNAVVEINEIVLKACVAEPARRYRDCNAMHAELALLIRGESIRSCRAKEQLIAVVKKGATVLAVLTLIIGNVIYLVRHLRPPVYSSDGPPSTNADANMFCEKGMRDIRSDNTAAYPQAYTNLHRAIELDPHFAKPYVGLLELRLREFVPVLGEASPEEMRMIANQLRKLGPNLAATQCARAVVKWADWDYPGAMRCALRATKADPSYELGHTWYGFFLAMCGDPVGARAQLAISGQLHPSKDTVYRVIGQTYFAQRDYSNAIAWERKALQLDPHHGVAFHTIGTAYRAMGDYSNALVNLELNATYSYADTPATRTRYARLRRALKDGGVLGYWREVMNQSAESESYSKAVAQLHLGDTNEALRLLEKSCAGHERWRGSYDGPLSYLLLDECWDSIHDHPRFRTVLDTIGFTKVNPPLKK